MKPYHTYPHGVGQPPKLLDPFLPTTVEDKTTGDRMNVDGSVEDASQAKTSETTITSFRTTVTKKKVKIAKTTTLDSTTNVREGLTAGSTYRLKRVNLFETQDGLRQAWTMEAAVDKTVRQIWAPRMLTRLTNRHLSISEVDPRKVQFMTCVDITYNGYTLRAPRRVRYAFRFRRTFKCRPMLSTYL